MRTKLRELRISKGYTQQSLATAAKINRATYTNIETGKKNPSLSVAVRIKNILSYNFDDIFLNQDVPNENKRSIIS